MNAPTPETPPRQRLSRQARTRQLLDVAWKLIRSEGTDALTLGKLAEQADVSKPVVYDHFGTRNGLLAALYEDYDVRQTAIIDSAIAATEPTLEAKAEVIASRYVACVLTQGREIPGVLAALDGSPELSAVKRHYQQAFIEKCRKILAPFSGPAGISTAALWALLGAADALAHAVVCGDIDQAQANQELCENILAMVRRSNG